MENPFILEQRDQRGCPSLNTELHLVKSKLSYIRVSGPQYIHQHSEFFFFLSLIQSPSSSSPPNPPYFFFSLNNIRRGSESSSAGSPLIPCPLFSFPSFPACRLRLPDQAADGSGGGEAGARPGGRSRPDGHMRRLRSLRLCPAWQRGESE